MMRPHVSVVIPVYDEERVLPALHARLIAVLRGVGRPFEVIYVDDGSTDGSLEVLRALHALEPEAVRVVELFRNTGQLNAVMAGFDQAEGEVIVTLDADLQNPPEEIPRLLATIDDGFDVVNTRRVRRRDRLFRRLASRAANRIASASTGLRLADRSCMLRAYRRTVIRQVLEHREPAPYLPTVANACARRIAEIPVAHAARAAGASRYPLARLLGLQYDLLASLSPAPLRFVGLAGAAVAAGGCALGFVALGRAVATGAPVDLVHGLFAAVFFLLGGLFMALGLLADQVGRIFDIVRRRPRYVVSRVLGPRRDAEAGARRPVAARDDGGAARRAP